MDGRTIRYNEKTGEVAQLNSATHEQRVEARLDRIIELLEQGIGGTTINIPPSTSEIAKDVVKAINARTAGRL